MADSAIEARRAGASEAIVGGRAQSRNSSLAKLDFLFAPVSPATLGLFRICFGVLMAWHLSRYMPYVTETLVHSKFFLTYDGFHWVRILPAPAMVALFWTMIGAAALVAAGAFYRVAAAALCLGWTYVLLLCQGHYNNHSYLFALVAFLLIFVDATRWLSVDRARSVPAALGDSVPYWQVFVFKAQIFLVYFYAGVAKLGSDWLGGYPMKIWLQSTSHYPLVGPFLATDAAAYLFSYGGLIFDLTIGFLLFGRRTRRWALIPLLVFHCTNQAVWNIGIFPWFMIAATGLFFDPDWPDRMLRRLGAGGPTRAGFAPEALRRRGLVLACLAAYLTWQAVFPLRHLLYAGSPDWTGKGSFFSWRMLTVDRAEAVRMRVAVPGDGTLGFVELDQYLNDVQRARMNMAPQQYVRFAHFIRDEMRRNAGIENAEIYVDLQRRLNERPFQSVIDPRLDVAAVEYRDFSDPTYLVPLDPSARPGTDPRWRARIGDR